jgi:serine protease inhibitor
MADTSLYALLIGINYYYPNRLSDGSSYKDLQGAVGDVLATRAFLQTMRQVPDDHILQLTSTTDEEAGEPVEPPEQLPTYANIIQKFQELGNLAPAGSHVYIHYSGHGGRARTIYPKLKGGPQGIDEGLVPVDIGQTNGQYLRDIELGKLLKDLVNKGLIVTVVLDSCHSGGATRGEAAVRGLDTIDDTPRPMSNLAGTPEELAENWGGLTSENTRGLNSGWLPESRDYVLLAACRPNEFAYEYAFDSETKQRSGALTYWLLDSLRQQTSGLTYKDLHDRLNGKIRTQFAQQTPMLMGEGDRLVFGSDRADIQYSIPVLTVDTAKNTVKIEAGQSMGLRLGAEFAIYPNGTRDFSKTDDRLAIVKIDDLGSTSSQGPLEAIFGQRAVDTGDVAILIAASTNLVKNVRLLPQQAFADETEGLQAVQALLGMNPRLTLVESGTPSHYTVTVNANGEFEIGDQAGVVIPNLRPTVRMKEPNAARKVVDRLVHLATYHATEALDNFDKNSPMFGKIQVSWLGKLQNYDPADPIPEVFEPFSEPGNPTIEAGEWIFLKIQNNFSRAVNVAVLNLQSDWAIQQIKPADPGSKFIPIDAGKSIIFHFNPSVANGYLQVVDVVKVFAAIDSPDFRLLSLSALDQPRLSLGIRTGLPLEALLAEVSGTAPSTRNINPARYPSQEWTTQQVRITVAHPGLKSIRSGESMTGIVLGTIAAPMTGTVLNTGSLKESTRSTIARTRQIPTIAQSEELLRNVEKLVQGQNSFSFKLLNAIATPSTQGNIFIAPLSIAIALMMILNVSKTGSPTQRAMLQLLEAKGMTLRQLNEAAYTAFTKIQADLDPTLSLALANSIWTRTGQPTDSGRSQTLVDYYDAEVWQFSSDIAETVNLINGWISGKTNAKVQDVVDAPSLVEAVIVLINAVYFKGMWASSFNPDTTRPYLSTNFAPPHQLMMMSQSGKFDYCETDDFQAIRLAYANSNLSMAIFLPQPGRTVEQFQSMLSSESWQSWQTAFQTKEGTIELPRFKIADQRNLLQDFLNLANATQLDLQLADEMPAYPITSIIHQAFLEVNEAGSEAAAATVVTSKRGLDPDAFRMTVDRPFVCIIHDRNSGVILFTGIIKDPT